MARLRTEKFQSDNLEFSYTVNIDKEGNFTTTIPEDVVSKLQEVAIKVKHNRMGNLGFFSEKSLGELVSSVEEIAKQYSEKELIEEKIIFRYAVEIDCSYWKSANGDILPNGSWDEDRKDGDCSGWVNGKKDLHSNNRSPFGFNIFVEVQKVKVWKFKNGETTKEYNNVRESDLEDNKTLSWVNSIYSIADYHMDVKEVDYSPEIAIFFKNMLSYVFNMNENMINLFGKDFDLKKIDMDLLLKSNIAGQNALTDNVKRENNEVKDDK